MPPATLPQRILAMDVLRGLALCGILVVNMPAFAMPTGEAFAPDPRASFGDRAAWLVMAAFFETKFFALFSLLFGMGLVLQEDRCRRSGRDFARIYPRRLAVLAFFGLAHAVLLFMGDILFVYAIVGFFLFFLRHRPPRTLLLIAALFWVFGVSLSALNLASPEAPPGNESVSAAGGESPAPRASEDSWSALERKAYREGPLGTTLWVNAVGFAGWLVISSLFSFNWKVVACFFLGAALMKLGIFHAERAAWHRRLFRVALPLGVLIQIAVHLRKLSPAGAGPSAPWIVLDEIGAALFSLGVLGALLVWTGSGRLPSLQRLLSAAGRMALTNYILQSLISAFLFRWYGLGLYERLNRMEILALALLVVCVQIALSRWWLSHHRMGPLEALWRRWTYGAAASPGSPAPG